MGLLTFLIFGLIVGAIAKFLMPGRDPGGIIVTMVIGVIGSYVGGFLANAMWGNGAAPGTNTAGWIGSILGAMILLAVYRMVVGRRTVVR